MRWKERSFVTALGGSAAQPVLSSTASVTSQVNAQQHHTPSRLVRDPLTNEWQEGTTRELHEISQQATLNDLRSGFTISGFYYVSLRRYDGLCEGLYYDPQTSPCQCLRLESRRRGAVGAWGFR